MSTFCLTNAHRTLYESKGLEFNNVGLVFFFTFTLLTIKPRSCYTTSLRTPRQPRANGVWCLPGHPMGTVPPMPQLSMKHVTQTSLWRYVTCSLNVPVHPHPCYSGPQLKFLYLAITRARKNLWIVDNSESAEPMKVPEKPVIPKSSSFVV